MKHLKATIYGRVQGVSFRYATLEKASELDVSGWVKNMPDGSVYLEAEASEEVLKEFLGWCRVGPAAARVDKVDYDLSDDLKSYSGFEIH